MHVNLTFLLLSITTRKILLLVLIMILSMRRSCAYRNVELASFASSTQTLRGPCRGPYRTVHAMSKSKSMPEFRAVGNSNTTGVIYTDVDILNDANRMVNASSCTADGFSLTVFGEPLSLARHRSTKAGVTYNPSMKAQRSFLESCQHLIPTTPLVGPLSASLSFHFKRPKAHYRSHQKELILKEGSDVYHIKRKDIDNLVKFVLDSLNKIAYLDDSQIAVLQCIKLYTEGESRTEIEFKKLHSIEDVRDVSVEGGSCLHERNLSLSRSTSSSLSMGRRLHRPTLLLTNDDDDGYDRVRLHDISSNTVEGLRTIPQIQVASPVPSSRAKRKPKTISDSLS